MLFAVSTASLGRPAESSKRSLRSSQLMQVFTESGSSHLPHRGSKGQGTEIEESPAACVKIASYNQHRSLLSSEPWSLSATKSTRSQEPTTSSNQAGRFGLREKGGANFAPKVCGSSNQPTGPNASGGQGRVEHHHHRGARPCDTIGGRRFDSPSRRGRFRTDSPHCRLPPCDLCVLRPCTSAMPS